MSDFYDYSFAVESISGGTNKVIFDDVGLPSIVVAFPKLKYRDVFNGDLASSETLPAFNINGIEKDIIWVSKYQNIVIGNRAYSLPLCDPKTNINFNAILEVCRNKGKGWMLMPNAIWSAIALWCKKNDCQPNGNNSYGKDISESQIVTEVGVVARETSGQKRITRTKTGAGPKTWYHNNDFSGIADLNGNVWEFCSGLRLNNGEINIILNTASSDCDMSESSSEWRAIMPDGSLVNPNTDGTLKFDYTVTPPSSKTSDVELTDILVNQQTSSSSRGDISFETIPVKEGINIPLIMKELCLFPADGSGYNNDTVYFKNNGEMMALRGAPYHDSIYAGVFSLFMALPRNSGGVTYGFRAVYSD